MMNCVLDAFLEHMEYLGIHNELHYAKSSYRHIKQATHQDINVMTYAGLVPYLYEVMLRQTVVETCNRLQHSSQINTTYITYKQLLLDAKPRMKTRMQWAEWPKIAMEEVETINLQPAIYCMLNEQHAFFAVEPPDWIGARCIMAFRFDVHNKST